MMTIRLWKNVRQWNMNEKMVCYVMVCYQEVPVWGFEIEHMKMVESMETAFVKSKVCLLSEHEKSIRRNMIEYSM